MFTTFTKEHKSNNNDIRYIGIMEGSLKDHLIQIADRLTSESTLEDVFEQLSLLSDIETSEQQEKTGETLSHQEVEEASKAWLL